MSGLPTPQDYAGVHTVHAICVPCDHVTELDLPGLVAQGHGGTPLVDLPLRCSQCGRTGHKIIVSGRSYPLGFLPA